MAAACGITLVKKFTYRGDANEEWSNTYWFDGTAPTTQSEADSMARALAAKEVTVFLGTSQIVRAYVYDDDSPTAVAAFTVDLTTGSGSPYTGTMTTGTGTYPAGDQAAWVRWKTSRSTSKGKAIYLRKYFHAVPTDEDSPSTADNVSPSWATAAGTFATDLQSGSFWGFGAITGRGHADTITGHAVSTFITTRTLHRRGRRP